MKIAISGKGGVGKSTIAAALALALAHRGERVLALDADPDANLAAALGIPGDSLPLPISKQIALIEERTGVKIDSYGQVFKMNPEVSDVAGRFSVNWKGVDLLTLGAINKGGGGCACPAGAFAKALVTDLVLYKGQTLIMDMEAGVEHLGRATAQGVDAMVIVVEPGQRSLDCAASVARMCGEIGVRRVIYVANKVVSQTDVEYINANLGVLTDGHAAPAAGAGGHAAAGAGGHAAAGAGGHAAALSAVIPYIEALRLADRPGVSVMDAANDEFNEVINGLIDVIYN